MCLLHLANENQMKFEAKRIQRKQDNSNLDSSRKSEDMDGTEFIFKQSSDASLKDSLMKQANFGSQN